MLYVAVFDTNVLLSAVGWRGTAYRCLNLARVGIVEGLTCQEILNELAEKLQTKLNFSPDQVVDILADLLGFLRLVAITNTVRVVITDPDDDKVLECAIVGGATHVVTGDRRHLLPMGSYKGIAIVTAAEFLSLVSTSFSSGS